MDIVIKNFLFLAAGVGMGYFLAKDMVSRHYSKFADEEIEEAREFYDRLLEMRIAELEKKADDLVAERDQEMETPQEVVTALKNYQGFSAQPTGKTTTTVEPSKPYTITFQVFDETEPEYGKNSVTYFEGDGKVCDEIDELLSEERITKFIGESNLEKFGSNQKDPNVIYVRNDKYRQDFEVTLSRGKYSVEVLGEAG